MTTALDPVLDETDTGDDGPLHVWCCDPFMALCGTELDGSVDDDDDEEAGCVVVVDLEETSTPCAAADCTLRSAHAT